MPHFDVGQFTAGELSQHDARMAREQMRDEMAQAALTGLLAGIAWATVQNINADAVGRTAYELADAMIKAREAK
jgi:hypothetical protein